MSERLNELQLYSVFKGEVASVQPYGVFVKLQGLNKDGLVHKSQMSKTRVDDPSKVSEKGDRVYVKIISVESDGTKIGLSMKAVNQDNGKDLDPNNVQLTLDEQRKKMPRAERDKITLDAILDTTCRKCGGKGHLAQDCFHVPGTKAYDLIPDVVDQNTSETEKILDKHKKKQKKNKHKKEKKRHKRSLDNSSSEGDTPKKKHKHKHRKHENSSSSDLDDHHMKKKHKHKR